MAEADGDVSELVYVSDEESPFKETHESESTAIQKRGEVTTVNASGFKDLLLKPEIMRAIGDCGFEHPSEVQHQCIPQAVLGTDILCQAKSGMGKTAVFVQHQCIPQAVLGTDILCQAKSGMGKTAVFVLSVLHQLDPKDNNHTLCVVLVHMRELAFQIKEEFDRFRKYLPEIRTKVVFGGVPVVQDKKDVKLNVPHVLIGTPGRTLQLVKENDLNFSKTKHFIIDECDKMLDSLEMRKDVQSIFKLTPHAKQVMMFSATLPLEIRSICKRFMHNPKEIFINDGSKLRLHGLQQYYVRLEEKEKNRKLVDLLDCLEFNQVLVFVSSVSRATMLNKLLRIENFPSITSHSRLNQEQRITQFKQFKKFKARIMVATNMLGRGVDFERVNLVINYDMPPSEDAYLHRVGRAGRFGTKGLAISFVTSNEDRDILEKVRKQFVVDLPELPDHIDCSTYMSI